MSVSELIVLAKAYGTEGNGGFEHRTYPDYEAASALVRLGLLWRNDSANRFYLTDAGKAHVQWICDLEPIPA